MRREERAAEQAPEERDPQKTVTLTFTYGSEKEEVDDVFLTQTTESSSRGSELEN